MTPFARRRAVARARERVAISMNDDRSMVREFVLQLEGFGEDLEAAAREVLGGVVETTAEAITRGNEFGPGVPWDTGFLRASFQTGLNAPRDGPSVRPPTPGRRPGAGELYTGVLDVSIAARAVLGDRIYITTIAEYAVYLEEGTTQRRFGALKGAATPFIAPVEARFQQICDSVAKRVGAVD